jgi:outer membrane protein assembly factor BamB
VLAAPALAESTLVIGTASGRLEALDPVSLRLRWGLDLDAPVVGSVAIHRGTAYATTAYGRVVAVPLAGPADAARSVETGMVMRAGPMPVPGGIVVCGVNGEIVRMDAGLERRWSARVEMPVSQPVLMDSRSLIVVSERGDVVLYR